MIPVDQQHMHDPENGSYGDCFRACLASLLELPAEDVPHFLAGGMVGGIQFLHMVNAWLRTHGILAMTFNPFDFADWRETFGVHGVYHIIDGPSPRGDWWHSVIGLDGEIVHDPHPDRAGLAGDERTHTILVRMNSTKQQEGEA